MRLVLLAVALAAPAALAQTVVAEDAFPGVRFAAPVGVEVAPGQPDRAYVVEQGGRGAPSRVVTLRAGDAAPSTFVDLSDRVVTGGEAGLLGLAFHPDYAQNGRVFVSYTAPVASPQTGVRVFVSRVSEFARSATDPLRADPATERVLLEVDQPESNHNAGAILFAPDGTLLIALGDGGGGGDPFQNGQDVTTLLGALLRIDVDDVPQGAPYGIPDDNPFALTDGPERDEIYAYGFRNPWKVSATSDGAIWLGDVGQNRWEEVDRVEAGRNYGWNEVEGPECFRSGCDLDAYAGPVVSYGRSEGQSITGGYVVETPGSALQGAYLYGDFQSGRLWAFREGSDPELLLTTVPTPGGEQSPLIASIDPGPPEGPLGGDPLVVDYSGRIYRLRAAATAAEPATAALAARVAGPNPFRERTEIVVEAPAGEPVSVVVYDVLGRTVGRLHDGPVSGTLRLRVEGLAPGAYTVRVSTLSGRQTLSMVRVR